MTDFYKMSSMMKDLFPSNPEADRQALLNMANAPITDVPPTKDYLTESVEVPQGSMPLDLDLASFAALAGVVNEKQKTGSAGQAKGSDPMPVAEPGRTKHPLKDKLVGEDDDDGYVPLRTGVSALGIGDDPATLVTKGLIAAVQGEILTEPQREALQPYIGLFVTILKNPKLRSRLNAMKRIASGEEEPKKEPKEVESIKERLYKELNATR